MFSVQAIFSQILKQGIEVGGETVNKVYARPEKVVESQSFFFSQPLSNTYRAFPG
jgi:hypothetical protein